MTMKKEFTILTVILLITAGAGGCKPSDKDNDLITVDLTTSYPEKELILQDFMDVEYIPLETNDEFITQGVITAIGDKYIIVKNWSNDGDIFLFDRKTGKGLRKINRKGQGAEEYEYLNETILDEDKNEIFVNSSAVKRIYVYDLYGNFKRSFEHTGGTEYLDVYNYDTDNLIRYDMSGYYKDGKDREDKAYHAIISKQDGSITRNITIPFDVIRAPMVQKGDGSAVTSVRPIIPYHGNFLLVDTSSDTIYNYVSQENKLLPFLVKTPTVDPEIFITMGTLTDRFYFMRTIKKVFDFTTGHGFPITDLMYDRQENAVYTPTVLNGDYVKKQKVDMNSSPVNNQIAAVQPIAAYQLVEAYENDQLKGKLNEIAAGLNEESNPVVMVMKYKK